MSLQMMGPKVAVSMQCSDDNSSYIAPKACVSLIEAAGASVVLVPPATPLREFRELMSGCQGFLVPGGNSIESWCYGGATFERIDDDAPVPRRDEFEIPATRWAINQNIPFLGICRGLQVLNVAFGGTLKQQLPISPINHWPNDDMSTPVHRVCFAPDGVLTDVLQCDCTEVNSLHRQSVSRVADCLRVEAVADDGVVEALRVVGHPFAVGVQWHPEGMLASKESQLLASAFVEACAKRL